MICNDRTSRLTLTPFQQHREESHMSTPTVTEIRRPRPLEPQTW
jgi:hypothetical protein